MNYAVSPNDGRTYNLNAMQRFYVQDNGDGTFTVAFDSLPSIDNAYWQQGFASAEAAQDVINTLLGISA